MYKEIILSKIPEYCKKVGHPYKKQGVVMVACPMCSADGLTANVIPNTTIIKCLKCQAKYNLIELHRALEPVEGQDTRTDEDILNVLKELLELDVQTKADYNADSDQFQEYVDWNWALVPCAKDDKNPIQKDWTKKENRSKDEWLVWHTNGLNIGVRTGEVSNLTVIDFDLLTKEEKIEYVSETTNPARLAEIKHKKQIPATIKALLGETRIQETLGGFHIFYKYVPELAKCRLSYEGVFIDVENTGGQVIIPPTRQVAVYKESQEEGKKKVVAGYATRVYINKNPIIAMPEALKTLLLSMTPAKPEIKDVPAVNVDGGAGLGLLNEGDGRNVFFTSLGGKLRKGLKISDTAFALKVLNRTICKEGQQLPDSEINHIIYNLEKYKDIDQAEFEEEIMDYLTKVETASKAEIEMAIMGKRAMGESKKKLDETLVNLVRDEKIIPRGRVYKVLQRMEWSDTIMDVGTPINFLAPYFHDYAYFNWGDLILIGAPPKYGKTSLSMNVVKRLVDQHLKPYYLYNETGGRFAKTALRLGLKDGDFYRKYLANANEMIIDKPNSIIIYDWIRLIDPAKTDELFNNIVEKLQAKNSIMFAFVQLKEGEKGQKPTWFAPNLIKQFPSLAVKYLYEKESDGTNTYFELSEIRDPKSQMKTHKIPTVYDWQTKEVLTVEELEGTEESLKDLTPATKDAILGGDNDKSVS